MLLNIFAKKNYYYSFIAPFTATLCFSKGFIKTWIFSWGCPVNFVNAWNIFGACTLQVSFVSKTAMAAISTTIYGVDSKSGPWNSMCQVNQIKQKKDIPNYILNNLLLTCVCQFLKSSSLKVEAYSKLKPILYRIMAWIVMEICLLTNLSWILQKAFWLNRILNWVLILSNSWKN